METKTLRMCLYYIEVKVNNLINDITTISHLEYIRDYVIENGCGEDLMNVLKQTNLITELFYFKSQDSDFQTLYKHLRELILTWMRNEKINSDDEE